MPAVLAPIAGSDLLGLSTLDAVIDEVTGEVADWRLRLGPIRAAQIGLFGGLAHVQLLGTPERQHPWQALLPQTAMLVECRAAAAALASSPDREARMRGKADSVQTPSSFEQIRHLTNLTCFL